MICNKENGVASVGRGILPLISSIGMKSVSRNPNQIVGNKESLYEYDSVKLFGGGYGNDLSVFDISWIKGVNRLVIGDDCFKYVNEFVID